jgi:predicted nucleotidyltransferase
MEFRAKDFVRVDPGLLFSVVADGLEESKVLCFLRYVCNAGRWRKVSTDTANAYLKVYQPEFLHFSETLDASLHAVDVADVQQHFRPQDGLRRLLNSAPADGVVRDLHRLCDLLQSQQLDLDHFGVTGSVLVGMQNHASDIDLVCYDRETFHRARHVIQAMIAQDSCQALNDQDWLSAYQRRACDFALDDYIWHEQRKYNKAIFNQRKFDLSLMAQETAASGECFRKLGAVRLVAEVSNDEYGFDYPAVFGLRHPDVAQVVCFTATYVGQARSGEMVEVAGQLEADDTGLQRVVVGSNREAIGEFIRVIR